MNIFTLLCNMLIIKEPSQYLGKLTTDQVLKIYMQLKLAIQYLQEHKIIHRDLSLDNILIDKDLNAKLSNFGISTKMN